MRGALALRLLAVRAESTEAVDPALESALEAALAAWPDLRAEDFVAHVASALGDEPASAARDLHLADVAHALACVRGDARAIAALEATISSVVPKALSGLRSATRQVDEVRQDLRERLLVAQAGERPKLLEYRGRGPLGAFLRVVALRIAYAGLREDAEAASRLTTDDEALGALIDLEDDPELAHLRATYGAELKAAFAAAVATLSDEERAVLRASVVDELSVDALAALYQVHRATAARWVVRAKTSLEKALRRILAERLGARAADCESVVALLQSRIDLSLERVLGPIASDD